MYYNQEDNMNEFNDIIQGTLYWGFLNRLDKLSGKYKVTVGQLERDVAEKLKAAGAKVSSKDGQGLRVSFSSNKPIVVKDSSLNELTEDQVNKIGNGTICEFSVSVRPSKWANVQQNCNGIKIIKLVEFEGTKAKSFQPGEGYKVQAGVSDFTEGHIND